ncbi:ribosome-binding factor A [Clostridium sp. K25]|uniref:Ribosome-binding factor A n=2 Tax=Clostridium TaxID=1485 RepID=A0AA40IVM4_CLONO|nr:MULTISPECIES: 30S ribosome-binding factor RbfA [Clostridium]KEI10400.1 ribosome-binding factor A [Clostridium sp. K25]KEI13647.1 ribosome-binding factor A [Clostridium novyi B str. NCTC 9691]KEI17032.1 ribosome-binding factor A [Clostridium haemolyticum NCTC 9693]KEI17603.1 ribosome-binding factor A [Clostridium novyi B str. ATCC 27606]KGN01070.1 ribosome-binding factor A [Clostridium haemolyticum NCTC 8350]
MAKYRLGRINEEVRKEISNIIRDDIHDPRLTAMVSVTRVEVTNDLRYAKVFISIFGSDNSKEETLEALKSSAGFIRREVGHRVKLRYTPEIVLELDESIEHGMHINDLLSNLKGNKRNDNR